MTHRILVVDDELSILATMAPLLRARGYEVATATSGQAALDAVDRQLPHLVILDLGLPDIGGIEVCRRLREGRATPILVLSARGAEQDKVAALDAGRTYSSRVPVIRRAAIVYSVHMDANLQGVSVDVFEVQRVQGDLLVQMSPEDSED